jgi:hypothetical protein
MDDYDYYVRGEKDVIIFRAVIDSTYKNFSCLIKDIKPNRRESKQARLLFDRYRQERKEYKAKWGDNPDPLEQLLLSAFISESQKQEYLKGMRGIS